MLLTTLGLMRFGFSLIFGISVAFLFADIRFMQEKKRTSIFLFLFFLLVQSGSWWFFGITITTKIYPLIIHIPLLFVFSFYYKKPWLLSAGSILSSYLCCQAPRWFGFLAGTLFHSKLADHSFYMISIVLSYYILKKFVARSICHLMSQSTSSCLLLCGVPLFYYLFDYFTVVYTNVLYNGTKWAVQFMPSVISVFYFIFLILYYMETQKEATLQRDHDMMVAQLKYAQAEFLTLQQLQHNAATYRHDLRHHFAFLQGLAVQNRIEELKEYLNTAQSDIDAITPTRYCQNETVNLILSSFASKAASQNTELNIEAQLPEYLPLSDTELCSILSNALENALHACMQISDHSNRIMKLRIYSKNQKLCIDIQNRFKTAPQFFNDLPFTAQSDHGYGTKSMATIISRHGGVWQFKLIEEWFVFQASV